jgi:AraC-like DNA-binding protein
MDPITDLFLTTQVASVVHARLEATAPWGLKTEANAAEGIAKDPARPAISPSQLAHFGIAEAMPLAGGDCFLLAPGSSYTLRDDPRTQPRSFCEVAPRERSQLIQYGGGGAPTTIISGWFQFEQTSVRILKRLLPLLILVRADEAQSLALHTTLNMLASETGERAPGSDLAVNRLADVLFIQCIRAHFGSRSEACRRGVLHAIFDPQIGVALKSMHENVEEPWTVESLAAACGMSRSAFAAKFKELVGETPLEYLTNWRMHKATALLRKGEETVRSGEIGWLRFRRRFQQGIQENLWTCAPRV